MSDAAAIEGPRDLLGTPEAGPAAVRGGVLRIAGYLFGVALSVVSAALLFRHLGVVDGGRYVTVVALVALFGGLTEAGLASIAVRKLSVATPAATPRGLLRDLIGLRLALSVTAGAAAVAFAAVVGYAPVLVAGTALAAVGMVAQNLQTVWAGALSARLRFGWVTALDLMRQVVTVGGIVVLALVGAGLLPFLFLAIPAALAALVPTAVLVHRSLSLAPTLDWPAWKKLLRDVAPYAAATAVAAVYFRVSLIIVSLVSTEQQTGYFAASFRVVEVLFGVPVLAVSTAFPIFARAAAGDPERLRFAVQRVLDVSAVLGGLVVVGVFVAAPAIIAIIAGADFAPADRVLRIQSIGLLGSFLHAVWGYALLSLGRHRMLLYLALVPLVVNAALTALLAPAHGAEGAAVATLVGEALLAVGGAVALRRAMRGRDIRLGTVARALLVAVPCGALALVPGVPVVVLAILAGGAYLLGLWLVGALPRDLLRDLVPRS